MRKWKTVTDISKKAKEFL